MPYAKKRRTVGGYAGIMAQTARTKKRKIRVLTKRKRSSRKRTMRKRRAARQAIKKVVEKVISCKDNVGVYRKSYSGEVRCDVARGSKTVAIHMQRLQANTGVYDPFSMGFHPYNLKRILDAASVLYNNKTKSVGGPANLGPNFNAIGLKVDVLYASYHLALTNMTNTQYYVEIVEFTNKFNSIASVMDVIEELLLGTNWVGGVPGFVNAGNGIFRIDCDLDFGMIKGVANRYAVKHFGRKLVRPGSTINYFTKDKMCVDFQKQLVTESAGGAPEIPSFAKGEKQVVVIFQPVVGLISDSANFTYCAHTVAQDAVNGFVAKVDEVFKIIEPDATLDEYQGDKRCFLSDHGTPGEPAVRYERDYGPTSTNYISVV